MKELFKASLLGLSLALVMWSHSANAGGDLAFVDYVEPQPKGCYLRSDVGVAFGTTSEASYLVGGQTAVGDEHFDTGYFFESGYGCHLASRLRAELVAGYHSKRDFEGNGGNPGLDYSAVNHYTLMTNFYYDFRKWRRIRPYVGVGVGFAYNVMDEWHGQYDTFRVEGGEDLSLAWSLMAGFGYQLTPRTTLDVAYRYMNFGDVTSGRVDTTLSVNPPFYIEEMGTHQIKAGLRYQLSPAAYEPVGYPLK